MRAPRSWFALMVLTAFVVAACQPFEGDTYTLYRNSALDSTMRIHVATFDTGDGNDYNVENCEVARGLFQDQVGVSVRYWCEKGAYRK